MFTFHRYRGGFAGVAAAAVIIVIALAFWGYGDAGGRPAPDGPRPARAGASAAEPAGAEHRGTGRSHRDLGDGNRREFLPRRLAQSQ